MTTYLLDANVLIALTVEEHEHHARVATWASEVERLALCPVVEGALVRFMVRLGESTEAAIEVLRRLHADPRCEFWPDSMSYADADLSHIRGHRQVTDAYLVGLALARGVDSCRLATLDKALAQESPSGTTLIPASS